MPDDVKRTLLPKLRFPEFHRDGGWETNLLGKVAEFVTEKTALSNITAANYVSTENLLPDYGGLTTAAKLPPTSSVTRYQVGDVLISNIRPYLKKVWRADRNGGASNDVIVIRVKDDLSKEYFPCLLKNDSFIAYVMRGAKGLKMPRGDVTSMRDYLTAYPGRVEQKKIADCLTSLDEAIATQGRKAEALKTYKKGLMQQLFPCEGEAVPRLRFPEFRAAPGWQEKKAGSLFVNRIEGGEEKFPIYSVTMNDGMVKRSSLDRCVDNIAEAGGNKKACKNDIAYNMMRMWQGASGVAVEDCMVSPAYVILTPQADVNSYFFGYLLKLPRYLRLLTSHSQGLTEDRLRLYYRDFATIPLPQPDVLEQAKIADFLLSVDNLIATEIHRLNIFKSHRNSLMQQLFPSLEED